MDVRVTIPLVILVLVFGRAASQNATEAANATSDAKECLTAKNVSGVCVPRQSCDYGTPAIDRTLFATRGYTRPCTMEEVCCPSEAMVHVEPSSSPNSFDSDEDDDA